MGGGPRETERTGLLASASEKELELRQRVVPISGGDDMEDGKKVLSGGSSGGASEKGASEKAPDYSLGLVFAGFVLTSLGNRLFQKLQTIPMYNYPITVNLSSTIMYVPVCFCYIIPAIMCMDRIGICRYAPVKSDGHASMLYGIANWRNNISQRRTIEDTSE